MALDSLAGRRHEQAMFKLLRLLILLPAAFAAGWIYESQAAVERCSGAGGTMRDGICRGVQ